MTQAPLPTSALPSSDPGTGSIFGPVHLTRAMIFLVGIVFAILFYYTARWLPWPTEPGFRGSLAQPKPALVGFVVAIVLLVVLTFIGTFLLGRRWFLAGLMAATAGFTTWSVRGGTMTAVLFNAQNSGTNQTVFIQMIVELIVFFGIIASLWSLIWNSASSVPAIDLPAIPGAGPGSRKISRNAWVGMFGMAGFVLWHGLQQKEATAEQRANDESRSTSAAMLTQTALMIVIMMILCVTPLKKQVLTSVFLAGMLSTAVAEYFFANRETGRWYWVAPLLVGTAGYIAGYISPGGLETGDLQGAFAPLTRVLPLDYASMGITGVLFGYWWMEPDAEPATSQPKNSGASPAVSSPATAGVSGAKTATGAN